MATVAGHAKGISFGPFTLSASERLLTREGAPVELGARALDILVALTSAPNEVLSKRDLMSRVWPGVTVEEGSLRFHVAGLRKALGDGKDGARFITTLPGRGYCFVASLQADRGWDNERTAGSDFPHANLPNRLSRMLGRDDDVLQLSANLIDSRFVTIVGPGGVGKTTVAIAVAHSLAPNNASHAITTRSRDSRVATSHARLAQPWQLRFSTGKRCRGHKRRRELL